jgi:hypothetical protein
MITQGRSLVELFGVSDQPRTAPESHQRLLFGIVKAILCATVLCAFVLWQQAHVG